MSNEPKPVKCNVYKSDTNNAIIYAEYDTQIPCFYCKHDELSLYFIAVAEFTNNKQIYVCNDCFRKINNN